eukprot:gi/632945234/ref/XP_007887938.1/ PREDICTED: putative methyltransferase NSUN6 isoform X1 [Callorhinchus milii]
MVPVFPKISLKSEVEEYLRNVFTNRELLATLGSEETEIKFEALLSRLSHPPAFTSVRVNTCLATIGHVKKLLIEEIQKQFKEWTTNSIPVLEHPKLPDVLLIPVIGPRINLHRHSSEVIVGAQCGNAVLRGAHVFAPGILSAPKFMKVGAVVSVYSDIDGKCKRGAKEFTGPKVFVGNGIAELSRDQVFCSGVTLRGIGIRMTEAVYMSPSFDNLLPGFVFLQNLPSVVVSHVLNPKPGERILDICAAPGGKTTHIAALMHDKGEVLAMDKIANKLEKIKQNAKNLQLQCIKAFCYDGTKALDTEGNRDGQEGPPYPPESFDRVLLDAPCSGLGQRPNMACACSLKEITCYQPLQRKLFRTAVHLLKPGGILVYSTCTITLAENEEQVAWALASFRCLQLQQQEPHLGGEGMMGAGLSRDQLKLLQRFDPASVISRDFDVYSSELDLSQQVHLINSANEDTIGFFIAKFLKVDGV